MLAKINVVELPIPAETVYAIHNHPDANRHVERAAQLGLLEEGTDPETRQPRYYVSNVLRPLIRPLITDDEYTQACAAAARSLYQIGSPTPPPPDPRHDLHRPVGGGTPAGGGGSGTGDRPGRRGPGGRVWLPRSRFADARDRPLDADPGPGRRGAVPTGQSSIATGRPRKPWPATSKPCICSTRSMTGRRSSHPQQHRRRVPQPR